MTSQNILPKRREISLNERLSKTKISRLVWLGLLAYLLVGLIFTSLEYLAQNSVNFVAYNGRANSFWDLLYFNFTTILTIGFGDFSPFGYFRFLSILEAFIGVALFSVFISFLTIKTLLPKENSIVFSKYGYYCIENQSFMVIYLNISKVFITNVETCSYVKTGNHWEVSPAVRAPFITGSVQTFYLENVPLTTLVGSYDKRDCLRVGISGSLGMANYSTSIEYFFKDIVVILDRKALLEYNGFGEVDHYLKNHCSDFTAHFHYCPKGAEKLLDFIERERKQSSQKTQGDS